MRRHPRLFVLSGAGISTDSGIPGYRDENGEWKRSPPITLQEFLGSLASRQRYWARSMIGWPVVAEAQPNAAHRALARLEAAGHVPTLVTQNVDGLHQRAGSSDVIELHGSIGAVTCLDCGTRHARATIQQTLEADNPALLDVVAEPAADGDAHLEWHDLGGFRIPACPNCGGLLKPSVVFFGENVPRVTVDDGHPRARGGRCDAGGRFVADGLFGLSLLRVGAKDGQADRRDQSRPHAGRPVVGAEGRRAVRRDADRAGRASCAGLTARHMDPRSPIMERGETFDAVKYDLELVERLRTGPY